ncbi:MAG: BrnT family toxin [Gemmatimonadota bacterium]|nr:BrnT family toxin [Gemmatimonadota bacterium]
MDEFAWDDIKSERNLERRGFDFEYATRVFRGPVIVREDRRREYGEDRLIALGVVDGVNLTVVYTDRVELGRPVRRIISARHSNRQERAEYGDCISKG